MNYSLIDGFYKMGLRDYLGFWENLDVITLGASAILAVVVSGNALLSYADLRSKSFKSRIELELYRDAQDLFDEFGRGILFRDPVREVDQQAYLFFGLDELMKNAKIVRRGWVVKNSLNKSSSKGL